MARRNRRRDGGKTGAGTPRPPGGRGVGIGNPLASPELLAAIDVDPDLFLFALEELGDAVARRQKRIDPIAATLVSYCDYHGLDPDDALEPETLLAMAALAARIAAFFAMMERLPPSGDPERLPALAEAACRVRLIEQGGSPAFQMLDFLAALSRAEAAGRV